MWPHHHPVSSSEVPGLASYSWPRAAWRCANWQKSLSSQIWAKNILNLSRWDLKMVIVLNTNFWKWNFVNKYTPLVNFKIVHKITPFVNIIFVSLKNKNTPHFELSWYTYISQGTSLEDEFLSQCGKGVWVVLKEWYHRLIVDSRAWSWMNQSWWDHWHLQKVLQTWPNVGVCWIGSVSLVNLALF